MPRDYTGPKKFTEPVALSSTASADLPLPGTAFGSDFVLLALRARCKGDINALAERVKGSKGRLRANCALFFFQQLDSDSCSLPRDQKEDPQLVCGSKKIRRAGFAFVPRFR